MTDMDFPLLDEHNIQVNFSLPAPAPKQLVDFAVNENALGTDIPFNYISPSPRAVEGWESGSAFPFTNWLPESGPLGEKDISLFLEGLPAVSENANSILGPTHQPPPHQLDIDAKTQDCLDGVENLSDERIAMLFREMVEDNPQMETENANRKENSAPSETFPTPIGPTEQGEGCHQLLQSALMLGSSKVSLDVSLHPPFSSNISGALTGNARSETQHSEVTGEQTMSTAYTMTEGVEKPPSGANRRRRRSGGGARSKQPKQAPSTAIMSAEELKRLRRVKNRESVEKCRTKQRLRMEALQIEQTCLQGENKVLRETADLIEKNMVQYMHAFLKAGGKKSRLERIESLIQKQRPGSLAKKL